jgi:penicillin-binding protein 1C
VHQAVYKKIFQKNDDGSTAISYASEIIERWPDEFSSCRSAFEGIAGNYSSPPKILSPLADKKYIVLKGEDSKDQKLCLKASTSSKLLYWFVDGSLLGSSSPKEQMFWKLQKGSHKIVCADERGNSSSVNILAISLE